MRKVDGSSAFVIKGLLSVGGLLLSVCSFLAVHLFMEFTSRLTFVEEQALLFIKVRAEFIPKIERTNASLDKLEEATLQRALIINTMDTNIRDILKRLDRIEGRLQKKS